MSEDVVTKPGIASLDEQRTRNYAMRLVAMVERGEVGVDDFIVVLREHAAGPPRIS